MIVKRADGYHLLSKDGSKNLGGPYETRKEAVKREQQVSYFKHMNSIITKNKLTEK